jgi:predicted cupin superfamily sugar epimerase
MDEIIRSLRLRPHPEGGFFRETFRSPVLVETPRGPRSASTAIYFFLRQGEQARPHRVLSDEVWHHYDGAPLLLTIDGTTVRLDKSHPQAVVPAGARQSAVADGGWVLCGCTVAPGFDFADWELG